MPNVNCRCCGRGVINFDGYPIHTKCIPKHWGKHAHNVNASRCKEFGTHLLQSAFKRSNK